jgi:hypothetical protein
MDKYLRNITRERDFVTESLHNLATRRAEILLDGHPHEFGGPLPELRRVEDQEEKLKVRLGILDFQIKMLTPNWEDEGFEEEVA